MEDLLKILLITGVLVFGLIKQAKRKKDTFHPSTDGNGHPMPNTDNPMPENWNWGKETQPETIPTTIPHEQKSRKVSTAWVPSAKTGEREGVRTTHTDPPTIHQTNNADATIQPPDIHSIEEVRKGIIWSEILKRKYE